MASYGRDTDADEVQRSKELIKVGRKTRKAQYPMLYICDNNKEKRSKKLRSIPGVLPCLILKIGRLWARTKNEYTVDDFLILTIREPWLLKKFSTSTASTWLAGKGIDATRSSRLAAYGQVDRTFQKIITRKEGYYKDSISTCTKDNFMRELQNKLAHTFTYFVNLGFWQLIVFKVWKFPKLMRCSCLRRHYAHACAVWCSWCSLEWLDYPYDKLVISRAFIGRKGSEWRVAFSQPRYLACS
jgi:hypothetical protein